MSGSAHRPATGALATVARYYDACNTGDSDGFTETLHPEVVHYFLAPNLGSSPVGPRERLASYWQRVQPMIDGVWVVDHGVATGDEAVIEWSLFWTPPHQERVVTRGAEWFVLADGLIREIRSYYQQRAEDTELEAFPYPDRGYSGHGAERSELHDARRTEGGRL